MGARIFVGGLPYSVDDEQLNGLFAPFGAIDSAHVITDRETGRSRGFGFVEMADDKEAETAIGALNGSELGGRSLTVNEARPQKSRGGDRDNFGGGRGAAGEGWGRERTGAGGNRRGRDRDNRRDRW